jgi:hypothetical protein
MMRQTGFFAMLAATLLAAQMGCHGKNEVQGPKDEDKDQVTQTDDQTSCEVELALECAEGMVDGCSSSLTAIHICMPSDQQASQPCEQEIARECGEGLVDACLMDPPAAQTHVCVSAVVTEPTDPDPTEPTDPDPSEPTDPEPTPESTEG